MSPSTSSRLLSRTVMVWARVSPIIPSSHTPLLCLEPASLKPCFRRSTAALCVQVRRNATSSRRTSSPRSGDGRDHTAAAKGGQTAVALLASGGLLSLLAISSQPGDDLREPPLHPTSAKPDDRDPTRPRFRIAEIRTHDAKSPNPWVTRGDKVYDITDWIPAHPGGRVILRAAGGSIDPYWNIFTIHKVPYVEEILEQYLIGFIDYADLVDGKLPEDRIEDPFVHDPVRHPDLITMTAKPRNAETPAEALAEKFLTPNELFYVRNHMWVPQVEEDASSHTLTITLPDGSTKEYSLGDLRSKFRPRKVTAVLQCSGNRRRHMTEGCKPTNGLQWNAGAISCAVWEGARLVDVLEDAGFPCRDALSEESDTKHVWFSGLEAYGASIPIATALDPWNDVILAYSMNGKPLPRDHGFPLRALVPGHVAARSVKWLSHIELSDEESPSQWQRRDYKCFGPNVGSKPNWDSAPAIQEMPVTSAITSVHFLPQDPSSTPLDQNPPEKIPNNASHERRAKLKGYAYSGGGKEIIRVDLSLDGGKTWTQAELLDDCSKPGACSGSKHWSWKRWVYTGTIPLQEEHTAEPAKNEKGGGKKLCSTLIVKATDSSYNCQPEKFDGIYNVRGNLATAWHRQKVCISCNGN